MGGPPRFRFRLVEAWLAGNERPWLYLQPLSQSEQELDERRIRRQVRPQPDELTRILPEGALVTRAGLEDVDGGK